MFNIYFDENKIVYSCKTNEIDNDHTKYEQTI